jgi:2-phospho-L-lactate guanylyltransferase
VTTCAVIPIKNLSHAKQRLAGVLSSAERQALFQAMVEDVLRTLSECSLVDESLVVTDDPLVVLLAKGFGAAILPEPERPGLIPAVTTAAAFLRSKGVKRMLFVPGDVPLISADDLEVVLTSVEDNEEPEFTIVPAADLGGSNCIVCSPPDCMKFGFGEDSFRRHLGFARELGIEPRVIKLPALGLDVDTPHDLEALMRELETRQTLSSTHKYLMESGIIERLGSVQETRTSKLKG